MLRKWQLLSLGKTKPPNLRGLQSTKVGNLETANTWQNKIDIKLVLHSYVNENNRYSTSFSFSK